MIYIILYFVMMNVVAFALMGIDKKRAVRQEWRISEAKLFLSALLGGSIGAIAGMRCFHHKTKHWYFVIGMPLILIGQVTAGVCLYLFM